MPFGQIVVGPPGSGKTTYCSGMQQLLTQLGRKPAIINLDPANDLVSYDCQVDIADLICLEQVMETYQLGPNGGLIYCMEYLDKNFDWLQSKLDELQDRYWIFDFPGQVELFNNNTAVKSIIEKLQKNKSVRLCCVYLVDSLYCTNTTMFISVLMTALSTMLHIALPHVNVLSKADLLGNYDNLDFNLEYYTEVQDLSHLLEVIQSSDDEFSRKYKRLNEVMCELIEEFNLVSFCTLNIENKESISTVLKLVDKCNGYVFGSLEEGNESLFQVAVSELEWNYQHSSSS